MKSAFELLPLHYNIGRYYDPSIGRYLSADPVGQFGLNSGFGRPSFDGVDANVYRYALNNPLSYVDPDGRNAIAIGAGVGAPAGPVGIGAGIAIGTLINIGLCLAGGCDAVLDLIEDLTKPNDDLTDDEKRRRNKACIAIWNDDTKWCDNNKCGRANAACHTRANENLRRCNRGEPRLPRMP